MSGGRKKYNIWIAYSDLFTNLSAFLFISAIGFFAAFGGGMAADLAPAACVSSAAATENLTASGLMQKIGRQPSGGADCVRHYRIGSNRFRSKWSHVEDFRSEGNESSQLSLLSQVCEPVWQTIARRDFRARGGRLVFRGIGAPINDWQSQPQCKRRLRDEPALMLAGMPARVPQMEVVSRCHRNPQAHSVCRIILNCVQSDSPRTAACRRVAALIAWDERMTRACYADTAREQAHTLFRVCERAPADENFQDQLFEDSRVFSDESRREDMRGSLWESVDYGAYVRPSLDARQSVDPSLGHLNSLPAGSVVIEVQYNR